MRLISYILLFTSFNAFSNSSDSIFAIGNNDYENEFYEKAIESYLTVDSTEHAHALYHNIGNCYYQIGDIASSILYFERALLLKNDLQTKNNLNLAKKRIQEIESIPKLFFIRWWNSIAQFLNSKSWLIFTCISVWISCFLLFVFFENRQKGTFNLFITALVITIILVLVSQRSSYLSKKTYAIVMKKTPLLSNISQTKPKQITPGNKVEIIKYQGENSLVILSNGEIGLVRQSDIEEL